MPLRLEAAGGMKRMILPASLILLVALVAFAAYVRLAPVDAEGWHVAAASVIPASAPALADPVAMPRGAWARIALPGQPADALQRIDSIATATPRTRRLAGSPEEGRITYVTRSRLLGYPDMTTVEAAPSPDGTILTLAARQRFGAEDMGVNAARLRDWLGRL